MHNNTLAFVHTLYERNLEWYKNTESKANILLGVAGAVAGIVTTTLFTKTADVIEVVHKSNAIVITCFIGFVGALLFSLVAAVLCFRAKFKAVKDKKKYMVDTSTAKDYDPKDMFFFGHIAKLDEEHYIKSIYQIDEETELRIYARHVQRLSGYVFEKMRWANYGFVSIVIGIIFILLASLIYIGINR